MKNIIFGSILMLVYNIGIAQQNDKLVTPKRNTVYLEAFGQGIYNSLSFDRLYRLEKKVKSSLTVGLTLIPLKNKPDHLFVFGVPVSYNWLFGVKNHHLELGIGFTALNITKQAQYSDQTTEFLSDFYTYVTPKISYRYQKADGGLFFRLSFTPPIALTEKSLIGGTNYAPYAYTPFGYRVFPWPGASLGWTIK